MKDYSEIDKEVNAVADTIWDMATNVWKFAELGFAELKSSASKPGRWLNPASRSARGIGGIDASWIATWGKNAAGNTPHSGGVPVCAGVGNRIVMIKSDLERIYGEYNG